METHLERNVSPHLINPKPTLEQTQAHTWANANPHFGARMPTLRKASVHTSGKVRFAERRFMQRGTKQSRQRLTAVPSDTNVCHDRQKCLSAQGLTFVRTRTCVCGRAFFRLFVPKKRGGTPRKAVRQRKLTHSRDVEAGKAHI